jgi:hypothetical protein
MAKVATHDPAAFRERLEALDVALLKGIPSQTERSDRASLLALHVAAAERFGSFGYLEIGSHLGGSLQAVVRDDRVTRIVSIDARPEATPDERGKAIPYAGNSTQRMLDNLAALPGADISKVHTIDADSRTIADEDVTLRPQVCFIDGEHTNESCLADARFCRRIAASQCAIVFHDVGIIYEAIATFLDELREEGRVTAAYPLPEKVFVIELGGPRLHATAPFKTLLARPNNGLDRVALMLARRPATGAPGRERLLRTWLSSFGAGRPLRRRHLRRRRKMMRKRGAKFMRVTRWRLRSIAARTRGRRPA